MHVNKDEFFTAVLLAAGKPPLVMQIGVIDYEEWKIRAVGVLLTDGWYKGTDTLKLRKIPTDLRVNNRRYMEFFQWVLNERGIDSKGRKLRGPI